MREQRLYPDIRSSKWAKTCQTIAIVGLVYCMLASVGFHLSEPENRLGFALLYLSPALLIIAPIELIISLITIQSWDRWADVHKRGITLSCSIGVLILMIAQLVYA
jgi:hypothetical protein